MFVIFVTKKQHEQKIKDDLSQVLRFFYLYLFLTD